MKPSALPRKRFSFGKIFKRDWQLWLLLSPILIYIAIFEYLPMYGIQIAFRQYRAVHGIWGSEWVGLRHFETFFSSFFWQRLFTNTILLNLYGLLWGFPVPIILALLLNRVDSKRFKKFTQTSIFLPNFISGVVVAGMMFLFLSPSNGFVNSIIMFFGGDPIFFMFSADWYRTIFIVRGIWQGAGWGAIIYLAALTSIDPEIYEAATIDGATIMQKIRHIDIPNIIPIAMMLLILNSGSMLSSNTQMTILLQTPGNISTSDILGMHVFRTGLEMGRFSYAAAVGLMTNVINFAIILMVNAITKKVSNIGLF